ncbi:PREDICTED: cytochrome P450 2C30-like [Priapulus caudatus]|uniref:Cytochrome P450 2C30-like n=1 Tax=Priapulus caudatus TaxID=37621 RepID=A0ABM1EWX3_PRICU|nr:PREDICTED: cytochrome P450 2C30-like [Priapulus caudatus]
MEAEASIADVPLHVGDSLLPTKTLLMNVLALVLVVVLARFYVLKPRRLPPGPTGWPLLGCLPYLKTKPLRYLSALGEQYGSVFSIYMGGRLAVILNDYEAVREAFEENGDAFGGRTPFYLLQVGKQDSRGEVHVVIKLQLSRCDQDGYEELKMLIHNLLVAGTETSATRLNWGLIYLSLNPQVQINVQQELDEVVGRGRQPGINDRKNLPYTEATVWNTQMWYAVKQLMTYEMKCFRTNESKLTSSPRNTSALGLPHATTRAVNFRGFDIPARTMIIPHMAHLMNDPKKFTDPEKFQPSRFLDEQGKFIGSPFVIPYSVGPRVCLGKTLANMEIYLVVSCILQSFTLKMAEEEPTPELNPDTVMRHPPPCKLIFDPR